MSISACHHNGVKRRGRPTWWRRRSDGRDYTFDPAVVTREDLLDFLPVRKVVNSKSSRNLTVAVWSVTGSTVRLLESGLEHDLHRRLDVPSTSLAVLPQAVRLEIDGVGSHTPDFLQVTSTGRVVLWDCKATVDTGAVDREKFDATADAARVAGWQYEIFTGMHSVERMAWMHVNGYRTSQTRRGFPLRPWLSSYREELIDAASRPTSLGALFALDRGDGQLIAAMWHLIGCGDLQIDMQQPMTSTSTVVAK